MGTIFNQRTGIYRKTPKHINLLKEPQMRYSLFYTPEAESRFKHRGGLDSQHRTQPHRRFQYGTEIRAIRHRYKRKDLDH